MSVKAFAAISVASVFAWIRVAACGLAVSGFGIGAAVWLWFKHGGLGFAGAGAGGAGAILGVLLIVWETFWPTLLFVTSVAAMFLYVSLANRFAVQTAICGIWRGKLEEGVIGHVRRVLEAMTLHHPGWAKRAGGATKAKLAMLQALREDPKLSGIQRRAMAYGIRKLALDDVDLTRDDATFAAIVSEQLRIRLAAVARPSFRVPGLVLLGHLAICAVAVAMDRR